jgi:hypothetical protein
VLASSSSDPLSPSPFAAPTEQVELPTGRGGAPACGDDRRAAAAPLLLVLRRRMKPAPFSTGGSAPFSVEPARPQLADAHAGDGLQASGGTTPTSSPSSPRSMVNQASPAAPHSRLRRLDGSCWRIELPGFPSRPASLCPMAARCKGVRRSSWSTSSASP